MPGRCTPCSHAPGATASRLRWRPEERATMAVQRPRRPGPVLVVPNRPVWLLGLLRRSPGAVMKVSYFADVSPERADPAPRTDGTHCITDLTYITSAGQRQ